MSHGKKICKWDLLPSDDGFSYLAQFVGDTGLRGKWCAKNSARHYNDYNVQLHFNSFTAVQLQEFVMGKTNESGQSGLR